MKSIRNDASSPSSQKPIQEQQVSTQTDATDGTHPKVTWQGERDEDGLPVRMKCPISQLIMLDPVVASDGHTYDRPMINKAIEHGGRISPITREKLNKNVFPNGVLQREVQAFLQANPAYAPKLSKGQAEAVKQAVQTGVPQHRAMAIVLASNAPEDANAEVFLYEMPLQNHRSPTAPSNAPSRGTTSLTAPAPRSLRTLLPTPNASLENLVVQWNEALDQAVQNVDRPERTGHQRSLLSDVWFAQSPSNARRSSAALGSQPHNLNLQSQQFSGSESVDSRRSSQSSQESVDISDILDLYGDDPDRT